MSPVCMWFDVCLRVKVIPDFCRLWFYGPVRGRVVYGVTCVFLFVVYDGISLL